MNFSVEVIKPLDVKGIENYMDDIVFTVARITKDFTNSGGHFPYRTGNLNITSMAQPIRKVGEATYSLDAPNGVEYAQFVWEMKNVNWTNKNTYPQWYETMFKNKKELIVNTAINYVKGKM